MFVRRLRQLQEEPGTVLPTPAVHGGRSPARATRRRHRARQGGSQRRPVRGQLRDQRPAPGAASGQRTAGRRAGSVAAATAAAEGAVLLAQSERNRRRPGKGHIRTDGQDLQRHDKGQRVRNGRCFRRPAGTTHAGHRPQHHDR